MLPNQYDNPDPDYGDAPAVEKIQRRHGHGDGARDERGKEKKGHRPERRTEEMGTTVRDQLPPQQIRHAEAVASANGSPDSQDARADRYCPLCGGEKGQPKDDGTSFVVCFAHNQTYGKGMREHQGVINGMGAGAIAKAILAKALSPAAIAPPSQEQWALAIVLPEMQRFEEEAVAAEARYEPFQKEIWGQLNAATGGARLPADVHKELLKAISNSIPGANDAYYASRKAGGRLLAARAFVARCQGRGVTPASFLTEAPTIATPPEAAADPPAAQPAVIPADAESGEGEAAESAPAEA